MKFDVRRRGLAGALALAAALSTGALATAAGTGVTFMNGSNHAVDLYTRYGGSSCINSASEKKVTIDAGQSGSIDSGDSKVCYCLSVPERATCPGGWLEAAAGSTQRLQ